MQKLAHDEPPAAPLEEFSSYSREFAHLAAIGWKSKSGDDIEWRCSGSLIAENFILTAAHCTQDEGLVSGCSVPNVLERTDFFRFFFCSVEPTVVRMGDLDLYSAKDDRYAQQVEIAEIIRHPEFNFSSAYHDIALLRLKKSVT